MVSAIASEISHLKNEFNYPIDTLYFGGGTPSILAIDEIEQLLSVLHDSYSVSQNAEITLEANPEDLSMEYLSGLHDLGINRLSIGVQSFDNELLKSINRNHSSDLVYQSFENARQVGFDNINLDLIYALPGSDFGILKNDVAEMLQLMPEHISLYAYTVEPKTVFENWIRKGRIQQVEEESEAVQFEYLMEVLEKGGYEQYEISNFARDQRYSRHNKAYWDLTPYLGIGPSAHSFDGKNRWKNEGTNFQYIKSIQQGNLPRVFEERTPVDTANEYIFTSLRTQWGCNLAVIKDLGFDLSKERENQILKLIDQGLLVLQNKVLSLSKNGRFLADQIAAELFLENP